MELRVRVDLPVAVVVAAGGDADVGEGAGSRHGVRVGDEGRGGVVSLPDAVGAVRGSRSSVSVSLVSFVL